MSQSLSIGQHEPLKIKIQSRTAKVGVIGMGYVGLPLALLFSEQSFPVTGFDIDQKKVDILQSGGSYIYRIAPTDIQTARSYGFSATSDYANIGSMDAIIICVPTPLNEHHEPDLSYIRETAESVAPHLRAGQLVILESTTYPGTTEEILVPISESQQPARPESRAAWRRGRGPVLRCLLSRARRSRQRHRRAPRHSQGHRRAAILRASELGAQLYGSIFNRTVPVSTPAVAEMTKLLENIYRCVNIALVNELKLLCLRMGIDIWEVIDAAKTKPFGFQAFYPGPGLGGHCIPIDPFYLSWKAQGVRFPDPLHRAGRRDQHRHALPFVSKPSPPRSTSTRSR